MAVVDGGFDRLARAARRRGGVVLQSRARSIS
jgi:hypothetical protein